MAFGHSIVLFSALFLTAAAAAHRLADSSVIDLSERRLRMLYSRAQLALMYLGICTLLPYNCLLNVQPYFKELLSMIQFLRRRLKVMEFYAVSPVRGHSG